MTCRNRNHWENLIIFGNCWTCGVAWKPSDEASMTPKESMSQFFKGIDKRAEIAGRKADCGANHLKVNASQSRCDWCGVKVEYAHE